MFKWNPRVHFYLRLGALIILSLFLLLDLIMAIYYPQPKFAHLGYGERISNYYSFFTTQTNYIVALYFFLYLFESKFKNTKPHYVIQLAVTTYITITMLVFWVGIVGQKDQATQYRPYHWVATVILHLVMPVIMITSYVLTAGDHYYHYEEHHKKYLWLIMLYMVAYLTIILIRGTYRHLDGKDPRTLFPYFFLNYFEPGGDFMVATALVVICVVAVSLQYFYIFINNLLYFRYYRNKNVKIVPIQYVMKTNKVTITGFIIGIIVLVFNIIIDIIVLDRALIYDNFFPQQSSNIESMIRYDFIEHYNIDSRVLIAFICIAIFVLIGFIFCFIFALKGKNIIKKYGREMPTSTLAASFPFIDSGLYDKQGMHLGTNNMGNVVLWDQFKITSKRTNHNMFIIGTSGMGKTYLLKIIINHHIKMGRKVIVIDPEREYQELCTYYDGNWIDAGDASIGKINPLQILDNNFIDEIENTNSSPLSNHLRFLEQWFKTLYPDFNGREINLLTKYLKLLYHQFNISNNSDIKKINNNDFPILSDFYTLLEKKYKNNKNELLKEFMDLIATDFLNDEKYQGLWNGHTTIKFNNNFIVYDVYNLFDLDDKKTNAAQLILMLNIIKKEIKENRFKDNNEIVIIVDEAHLAIDKDNPVALNFMYQMSKRIRKYKGSLVVATQNIADFVENETILNKTTAIINNSQYSFIMGLKPNDLKKVINLYKSYGGLTSAEQDYIARSVQGQGLLFVSGFERYRIEIQANKKEKAGFGKKDN